MRNNNRIDNLINQIIDEDIKMKNTNLIDGLGVERISKEISKLGDSN